MEKCKVSLDDLRLLLAEEIMGWRRVGDDDYTKPLHRVLKDKHGIVAYADWDGKGPHPRLESPDGQNAIYFCGCENKREVPDYPRDANAAFEVVEKLASRDYGVKLSYHPMGGLWTCRFEIFECFTCYHGRASEDWCQGDCNKVSHKATCVAICLAALATKDIYVEVE